MKLNNKFAIGCLVQWYEMELVGEYVESVKNSLENIKNKKNIIVDFTFATNQDLEKIDKTVDINILRFKFQDMMKSFDIDVEWRVTNKLVTIADYRRWFNDYYCEKVDVLMWGETDSLIPKQTFEILDSLHTQVKTNSPKYISFFSTCKMWDESWKPLEHPDFTDKPFIDGDTKNWWSLKYNMSIDEMYKINDKVEELDIQIANQYKFNGCGLVISSEVIKSGVNIPRSVFFIHEDTAFMHNLIKMFDNNIPQFIIKNILLVHNRKHPKKRSYILGEDGIDGGDVGAKRLTHDWYMKANKMCEHNAYNLFNQSKTYTWEDVFNESR
tara:strand:- start:107 stop:1084 length:978 start_codon:yes stop_codon:yes gene_type:complete